MQFQTEAVCNMLAVLLVGTTLQLNPTFTFQYSLLPGDPERSLDTIGAARNMAYVKTPLFNMANPKHATFAFCRQVHCASVDIERNSSIYWSNNTKVLLTLTFR